MISRSQRGLFSFGEGDNADTIRSGSATALAARTFWRCLWRRAMSWRKTCHFQVRPLEWLTSEFFDGISHIIGSYKILFAFYH